MLLYVNDNLCVETNEIVNILYNEQVIEKETFYYEVLLRSEYKMVLGKENGLALCQAIKKLNEEDKKNK